MSTVQEFNEEDVRLVDITDSIGVYFNYLLQKFYIVIIGVGGLTYGLYYYAKNAKPEYLAFTSFNTVDPKGIAASGLISLASSLGFGASGTTVDLLAGLYNSRLVFYNAMITDVSVDGKVEKLGDEMMRVYGLDQGFKATKGKENFGFTASDINSFSRDEDSIVNILYSMFIDGIVEVEYEVTSGLIFSEIVTPDYQLSKNLAGTIINKVSEYYMNEQVSSASISFTTINKKIDSLKSEIDWREKKIAQDQDRSIFNVKKEGIFDQDFIRQEVSNLKMMYAEAITTKESAKTSMKPLASPVRVVDHPDFATTPKYKSTLLYGLIGLALGIVLVIIPLMLRKAILIGREENALAEKLNSH